MKLRFHCILCAEEKMKEIFLFQMNASKKKKKSKRENFETKIIWHSFMHFGFTITDKKKYFGYKIHKDM